MNDIKRSRSEFNIFDPMGIMAASWEVQKAWLEHPLELMQEVTKLGAEVWALQLWQRFSYFEHHKDMIPAVRYDERFQDPIWSENPYFDTLKELYLLYVHWLEDAIFQTPETPDKVRRQAAFWVREVLNATAPTNFFWTNPTAINRFFQSGGKSLVDGLENFSADLSQQDIRMVDNESFEVGVNLATTPGAVVFRNELVELIQYSPSTEQVRELPIVIVSPWINKYYILDLTPEKSMVRYLVEQGFTVFVTSWKNPGKEMRNTTLDDYMIKGVLASIEAAREICQVPQVHLTGYCIGGTMVAALMAWLNRRQEDSNDDIPVAHVTLLTTLTEFSDVGDIDVFIDEGSVRYIEMQMQQDGYLDGKSIGTSFRMLRANSLIWHNWVHNYLYGEPLPKFDVLYWNTDNTRLPEAMHSFYLREFYLNNKLAKKDAVKLAGRPIDLARISQPLYAVGTEQDHITPWKGTFKVCSLVSGPVRYALSSSGHILGVINPPVDIPKRRYLVADASGNSDPDTWYAEHEPVRGSWWTDWTEWLEPLCGELIPARSPGNDNYPALADAPGTYVLER